MITKATVVGSGAMGTVMAQLLASNGIHVALLTRTTARADELLFQRENRRHLPGFRLSQRVTPTADAERALANAELVISAPPSQHVYGTWSAIGSDVAPATPICSVTKGLDVDRLLRPREVLAELAPGCPVAVLSGPSIAPELARCLPATVVVACEVDEVATLVQNVLNTSFFRIYTNNDVLGVELAGALKNVIALAAGMLDGLRAGDNAKAALLTRGLVEITRLGVAMGAHAETFAGLAGAGDLVTTCVSPLGRNRSAGERIGQGVAPDVVVQESPAVIEGVPTTRAVMRLAQRFEVEMPITAAVYDVLFSGKSPIHAITDLMQRPQKAEQRA